MPEHAPSKLTRITPMDIIAPGADLDDDSWKEEMMREWEKNWDLQLGALSKKVTKARGARHSKA